MRSDIEKLIVMWVPVFLIAHFASSALSSYANAYWAEMFDPGEAMDSQRFVWYSFYATMASYFVRSLDHLIVAFWLWSMIPKNYPNGIALVRFGIGCRAVRCSHLHWASNI